jgi:DNA-binding PadR family transcriptional regulator
LRLTETTAEYAYFTQLGVALFGDNGLLTTLGRLEALGVGCLNESGSLVLGTLVANCDEMSVGALTRYLNELVSERSVFRGLSRLERQGIITKTSGRVRLSAEWEQQFERLLTDADECCPRKRRGDSRRKLEQAANLARLRKGLLTDAERSYLKSQNCVYCDATGLQQQHFPPKKFIEDFTVINNRHFIWPICAHCNQSLRLNCFLLPQATLWIQTFFCYIEGSQRKKS